MFVHKLLLPTQFVPYPNPTSYPVLQRNHHPFFYGQISSYQVCVLTRSFNTQTELKPITSWPPTLSWL